MRFNTHSQFVGKHAILSASNSSWLNYDDDKMDRVYYSRMAAQRGTDLHQLAQDLVRLGVRLPDTPTTMNLYVNDCIGFRMSTEVTLFYSPLAFGTSDAISFRQKKLRVFDLKTGTLRVGPRQLEVYAAYFCLEYEMKPFDIEIELRVYQNDDVQIYEADPIDVNLIMDKIVRFEKRLNQLREEAE